MASTTILSIHSALDAVNLMLKIAVHLPYTQFEALLTLKLSLRNIKAFVLFSKKLANDRSLGYLLVRIEDTIQKNWEKIHLWLDSYPESYQPDFNMASKFKQELLSLEKEIEKWYVAMLGCGQKSCSLEMYEILEIISSVLENLDDFHIQKEYFEIINSSSDATEALAEQMIFLKSFILFVTQISVEPIKDLLLHTESITLNVCYLFLKCTHSKLRHDIVKLRVMKITIPTLVQKIKPINLNVYKTYTQVLSTSKMLAQSIAPNKVIHKDNTIAMNNFLSSLISYLWEILLLNTCHMVSVKDQFQELYEGLRSLRTILTEQQNFDMKTIEDIRVVLCDAGVLIFSLYPIKIEIDHGLLQFLLKSIKIKLVELGEKDPEVKMSDFPRTNELGFVDDQLEKLIEITSREGEPIAYSGIETIKTELWFLRFFLEEIMQLRHEQKELQALWDRILDVAYKVECFIDHLEVCDLLDSFSISIDSITNDIKNIKNDISRISIGMRSTTKVMKEETKTYQGVPLQSTNLVTNKIVGFKEEAKSIVDQLIRGSKELRVIAIVGMPGSGKTSLATKIYNDSSVLHNFHVCVWCPISQQMDKRKVLLDLLIQMDARKDDYTNLADDDLAENLRKNFKGKRYLIILDDIWDINAWNSLNASFPNDSCRSRIILTSRNSGDFLHNIPNLEKLHHLHELNEDESMELLKMKLFHGNGWPPSLIDFGKQIVNKCKGLPLTIVIVAGLLSTTKQESWKEIVNGLSSSDITSTEHCMNTLELSYKHLPNNLRPCFLYFGAFREDQKISARKLFRLWIAEGFIQRNEKDSQEDVVEKYLNDLVGRCLIMVVEQRSIDGGVKACQIHDLLHDFCIQKARDEQFSHLLRGYDELLNFNEPRNVRRVFIHSDAKHFKKSKLFCPHASSLLLNSDRPRETVVPNMSFVFHIFKLLKVLDLEHVNLGFVFPSEIEQLVQLAFLAIQCSMSYIPSSVVKLLKLETFIVISHIMCKIFLPDNLWNLQKLKYLYISCERNSNGGILPEINFDGSSVPCELDTLSGGIFHNVDTMERIMRKFPKIRKLKCLVFREKQPYNNPIKIVVPNFLSQLESLHMIGYSYSRRMDDGISFPTNLKKLTLSYFTLNKTNLSTIANMLQNIEVLKLSCINFVDKTWEMEEGEFSKICILKLQDPGNLNKWTACDDQFECLEKLVLDHCFQLEEIPCSCLENILTLDTIEVSYCDKIVVDLVTQIKEKREDFGNPYLNIITRHS